MQEEATYDMTYFDNGFTTKRKHIIPNNLNDGGWLLAKIFCRNLQTERNGNFASPRQFRILFILFYISLCILNFYSLNSAIYDIKRYFTRPFGAALILIVMI